MRVARRRRASGRPRDMLLLPAMHVAAAAAQEPVVELARLLVDHVLDALVVLVVVFVCQNLFFFFGKCLVELGLGVRSEQPVTLGCLGQQFVHIRIGAPDDARLGRGLDRFGCRCLPRTWQLAHCTLRPVAPIAWSATSYLVLQFGQVMIIAADRLSRRLNIARET